MGPGQGRIVAGYEGLILSVVLGETNMGPGQARIVAGFEDLIQV